MKIPTPLHSLVAAIDAAYEASSDDGRRPHLGGSLIGHPCLRHLWYVFRWAKRPVFPGRILRLFQTGHREEARMIDDLRRAGLTVSTGPDEFRQWTFREDEKTGGHFSLSLDGAVLGLPEAPETWHVLECKTHNEESFKKLQKEGVEKSKPVHYAQMQVGMLLSGMDRALYLSKNKNTDAYDSERVSLDKKTAKALVDKAAEVVREDRPLAHISRDPAWFECKFCDHHSLCFEGLAMEKTCRSCVHVAVADEAAWWCQKKSVALSLADQKAACGDYRCLS